jgi:hypothetical protein
MVFLSTNESEFLIDAPKLFRGLRRKPHFLDMVLGHSSQELLQGLH